ncbi:MAG: sigma-70 family RNA polymerase sigma factor [Deltaproteobacteria bacterium]|nr:MAG: sigma-70 family RNA polymerase sigma factor [Deltaproteobacteria bacterium]
MTRATLGTLTGPLPRANVRPAYLEHRGQRRPMPGGRGTDITQHDFPDELVRHRSALERSARRLCRNRQDAEDLVQTTLTRAWQRREQFLPGGNIGGWLHRILVNHHLDSIRKRTGVQVPLPDEVPDLAPTADDASLAQDTPPETVLEALRELPAELRDPLELLALRGKRYREIAEEAARAVRGPQERRWSMTDRRHGDQR